jgi:hypothetical protein
MSSLPQVHLVDTEGFDPWDSPYWDVWEYTLPPDELAALEAEALAEQIARHDAADSDSQWNRMMAEHSLPPANQVSPDELAMAAAGLALG